MCKMISIANSRRPRSYDVKDMENRSMLKVSKSVSNSFFTFAKQSLTTLPQERKKLISTCLGNNKASPNDKARVDKKVLERMLCQM